MLELHRLQGFKEVPQNRNLIVIWLLLTECLLADIEENLTFCQFHIFGNILLYCIMLIFFIIIVKFQ